MLKKQCRHVVSRSSKLLGFVQHEIAWCRIDQLHALTSRPEGPAMNFDTQCNGTFVCLIFCNAGAESMKGWTMLLWHAKHLANACLVASPLPNAAQSNAAVCVYFCRQLLQGFDLPLGLSSRTCKQQHRAFVFRVCIHLREHTRTCTATLSWCLLMVRGNRLLLAVVEITS